MKRLLPVPILNSLQRHHRPLMALALLALALLSGLLFYRSFHLNVTLVDEFQQTLAEVAAGEQGLSARQYRRTVLAEQETARTLISLRADLAASNTPDSDAHALLLLAGATEYLQDPDRFQAWLGAQVQTIATPSSDWTRSVLASGAQQIDTGRWCLQIEQEGNHWLLTSLADCGVAAR
jgi:hypothetical protein